MVAGLCYREIQGLADNIHQDFRAGVLKSLHAVSENQNQLKERIKALDNVLKQVKEETRSQIGTVTEFRRSCEVSLFAFVVSQERRYH